MIRVAIADDHPIVREGLRRIVSDDGSISVAGEASTAAELFRLLQATAVDVVLLWARGSTTAEANVREHVGRIDIAVSGFDGDEVGVRRQIDKVRDVVPGLAAVQRVIDLSRAAARPDDTLLEG